MQRLVKHRSSLHFQLASKIFSTLEDATGKLHPRHNLSEFKTLAAQKYTDEVGQTFLHASKPDQL